MKKKRIAIIDILRGFALLLIVLIHFAEHFEFSTLPENYYFFTKEQDQKVMYWVLELIRGKAYSIFALLFGLSFFIQMQNRANMGIDYRKGFAWRMLVLLIIGFFNSLIYRGDILHMYAIFSFPIILMYHWKSKWLSIIALLLLLQIPFVYIFIQGFFDSAYTFIESYPYWREGNEISTNGSFWEVVQFNFYKGRHSSWVWTIYVGRYLQIWALFIIGILLGRLGVFHDSKQYQKKIIKVSLISIPIILLCTYFLKNVIPTIELLDYQKRLLQTVVNSWKHFFSTIVFISIITLLYHFRPRLTFFKLLEAYGKLSLTNYISQGAFGVILFYGFGFGLWKHLGVTWSIILGAIFFFGQAYISLIWNKYFYYGPLEWVWRCTTEWDFSIKLRKNKQVM